MTTDQLSPEEFAVYFTPYIKIAGNRILQEELEICLHDFIRFVQNIPLDKFDFRYAEGKWTPLDIFLHIIDCERVFQHRAFWIARGCAAPLAGFEQDDFVVTGCANDRDMGSLIVEYEAVRAATIALIDGLPKGALQNTGSSNGNVVSATALIHCVVGHELHHLKILEEKYDL